MLINNRSNLSFTVEGSDPVSEVVTITFTDADTLEEVGVFQVNKKKGMASVDALKEILREIYDVFQDKTLATTRFDNKNSGTISFRDS